MPGYYRKQWRESARTSSDRFADRCQSRHASRRATGHRRRVCPPHGRPRARVRVFRPHPSEGTRDAVQSNTAGTGTRCRCTRGSVTSAELTERESPRTPYTAAASGGSAETQRGRPNNPYTLEARRSGRVLRPSRRTRDRRGGNATARCAAGTASTEPYHYRNRPCRPSIGCSATVATRSCSFQSVDNRWTISSGFELPRAFWRMQEPQCLPRAAASCCPRLPRQNALKIRSSQKDRVGSIPAPGTVTGNSR